MKRFMLLLLLFAVSFPALSTTIYEIKYVFDNSAINYTAFLVRYDNKTGFMRVRYQNDKNESKVVEMDFDEIIEDRQVDGVTASTLRFSGKNPHFILGNARDGYNRDIIWFKQENNAGDYMPWGVTSPGSDGKVSNGKITGVKLLNTSDISKSYANLFFGTAESFYVNLFPAKPTYASTQTTSQGTFRLVFIANTTDEEIGVSCQKDAYRIKQKFRDIATFLNLKFSYTEVSGSSFSRQGVLSTLNSTPSSANDIIVVCYSGHGFRYTSDDDSYPRFDLTKTSYEPLKENNVSLSEVYGILNNKNARLKLLLADCCNDYVTVSKGMGASNATTLRSRVQWSKSNCENLFLKQKGTIVASAASKGEVAYCNSEIGGYFLYNFVESLDKALSVFQNSESWSDIISETNTAVYEMTSAQTCKRPSCTQRTVSYISLK